MYGKPPTQPKLRYIEELGHGVRSTWEERVAKTLKARRIFYSYEPIRFRLQIGDRSMTYSPDFFIPPNTFIEVKGRLRNHSLIKIEAFVKQYPNYTFIVIGGDRALQLMDSIKCIKIPYTAATQFIQTLKGGTFFSC